MLVPREISVRRRKKMGPLECTFVMWLFFISKKKSAASVTFLRKRVAFFPLWPLWPLWCLCVAFLKKRRSVISSMKKKADFIEECTTRIFFQRGDREAPE